MKKIKLKINHLLFAWYYKRVPKFFWQWTFVKSVKMLIQNYEHSQEILEGKNEVIKNAIKIEQNLRDELSSLRIKLLTNDETIDSINKSFGTNFNKASDN